MIKKAICALLLTGSFSGTTSATSVDDMGFDVSSFKQTGQQISVKEPKAPTLVQESKLASYVSEVGVDVERVVHRLLALAVAGVDDDVFAEFLS